MVRPAVPRQACGAPSQVPGLRFAHVAFRAPTRRVDGLGFKVSVDFWTEAFVGSLPETARFFSKHRIPPHPGDTLFVSEDTIASRPGARPAAPSRESTRVRVRVVGTFRITGRFWSVPSEELTINVQPVGNAEDVIQILESRESPSPWDRD